MAEVFISYAHHDRDLARAIAEQLIEAGAQVWWDRELIAGDDFDRAILEQAETANCMVVIWTPESIARPYVRDEAQIAAERGRLVPVAKTGVQPPLGFRRFHLIELGPSGIDAEFMRALVRAVEERIDRTLEWPADHESMPVAPAPQQLEPESEVFPLARNFSALAMGNACVWLGDWEMIEVWDWDDKTSIGAARADAEALFAMPSSETCISCGSAIGYQAPDTVRTKLWEFESSLDDARAQNRQARGYVPGPWDPSRGQMLEYARRDSIRSKEIFFTFSWILGPVALSEDGEQIAIIVNHPQMHIQVHSISSGQQSEIVIPLDDCHPDELLFLRGGVELVTIEHPRGGESARICIWNVASRQRATEYELEWVTVNSVSRIHRDDQIVLGLDQSLAFLNVREGGIDARVEIQSRPVRSCTFDPRSRRIGVLTDKDLIVIDSVNIRQEGRFPHGYAKGVRCDLRGDKMAALVADQRDRTALVLRNLLP